MLFDGATRPCHSTVLFDRDGLGQIARLVDVEALRGGEFHREDLQGRHGEQWLAGEVSGKERRAAYY